MPDPMLDMTRLVESECGAVALGRTYLLPPLSSGGALVVQPWLRFHIPLIEPGHADLPHPALGQDFTPSPTARRAQARSGVQTEVPVKVREWIGPALASPDLVLDAQPPARPHSGVVVDRPVRLGDGAYIEVVRPTCSPRSRTCLMGPCKFVSSPR